MQVEEKEIQLLREHYDKSIKLVRSWGLSPFGVDFHIAPADKIYEVASYGVPGHFSHWTYGRDYWIQKQHYDHGHSKIYELVINSDPAQAFLLDTNSTLENMFVISHVLGHSDFFAENTYFSRTNRHITHTVTAFAERCRVYEIEHGRYEVERFIDDVLTIQWNINRSSLIKERSDDYEYVYPTDQYEDLFPEVREERDALEKADRNLKKFKFPLEPTEDLIGFLAKHGRLQPWQRDIMSSIREESQYFLPQIQTKIMNEGWASLIHRCSMHILDPDVDPGGIEFSMLHSSVLSQVPGQINPYWLGYNMFFNIIQEYGEHSDKEMANFDFIGGTGWEKVLEIRKYDNDSTFIRNYLNEAVCEKLDLFEYGFKPESKEWIVTEKDWENVRDSLVVNTGNNSIPIIEVEDADHQRKRWLYLIHRSDGRQLDLKYLEGTLPAIARLWGSIVFLNTQTPDGQKVYFSDGENTKLEVQES